MNEEDKQHMLKQVAALKEKLFAAMMLGPCDTKIELTTTEATLCYRLMFESANNKR